MLRQTAARRGRPRATSRCRRDEKAGSRKRAEKNSGLQLARRPFKNSASLKTNCKFRMNQSHAFWKWLCLAGCAALLIGVAFYLDGPVRNWIAQHQNRSAKIFMHNVSRFGDWPEHAALGLALLGIAWWRGSKKWTRIFLAMLLACTLAGAAARTIKIATGRARPSVKSEAVWNGPRLSANYNAFPSGHTAASTAFFVALLLSAG